MTTDSLLSKGIAALKEGRKAEARRLLMQVIRQDRHNEMAWLWLSGAVDTDEDRRICLANVLTINPNNRAAQKGFSLLQQGPVVEKPPIERVESPGTNEVTSPQKTPIGSTLQQQPAARPLVQSRPRQAKRTTIKPPSPSVSKPVTKPERKSSARAIGCLVVVGLIIFACILGSGSDESRSARPTPTSHLISNIEEANGYDWLAASEADRIALCKWLDARYQTVMEEPVGWRFLFDALTEFYRTDDPYVLRHRIVDIASMLVGISGAE